MDKKRESVRRKKKRAQLVRISSFSFWMPHARLHAYVDPFACFGNQLIIIAFVPGARARHWVSS